MAQPPFPMKSQGLESPPPVGGPPPAKMPPPGAEPDADDMGGGATVKPEAVMYHDEPHSCSGCEYMGADSQCAILKMQVSPEGGCNAFEKKGGEGEGGGDDSMMASDQPPAQGGMYGS